MIQNLAVMKYIVFHDDEYVVVDIVFFHCYHALMGRWSGRLSQVIQTESTMFLADENFM